MNDLSGRLIQLLVVHLGRVVQLPEYELRVAAVDALLVQIDVQQAVDRLDCACALAGATRPRVVRRFDVGRRLISRASEALLLVASSSLCVHRRCFHGRIGLILMLLKLMLVRMLMWVVVSELMALSLHLLLKIMVRMLLLLLLMLLILLMVVIALVIRMLVLWWLVVMTVMVCIHDSRRIEHVARGLVMTIAAAAYIYSIAIVAGHWRVRGQLAGEWRNSWRVRVHVL